MANLENGESITGIVSRKHPGSCLDSVVIDSGSNKYGISYRSNGLFVTRGVRTGKIETNYFDSLGKLSGLKVIS